MTQVLNEAERSSRATLGLETLLQQVAPWLVEMGTWIFGGLVAFNLVVIAALLTVGPVDRAVVTSVAAFACALPLEVAGIVVLRLSKDAEEVHLEALALQSLERAGFPDIRTYFPPRHQRAAISERRTRITLAYAAGLVVVTVALTLFGLTAALWHMGAWVAEASLAALLLSGLVLAAVFAQAVPPRSAREQRLAQQLREAAARSRAASPPDR